MTGGTRGLGLAMVRAFASAGAEVIVVSRKPEACEEVAATLRTRGSRLRPRVPRRPLGRARAAGRGDLREYGRVDVLVNNAGISPLYGQLTEVTEDLFDKVIGVNLKGPFRLAALVGERMVAAGSGSIINVSSTGAVRPTSDIVPYAAAKAGVNAMTIGLAHAFGPKVRVNAIMPGPFLTTISPKLGHGRRSPNGRGRFPFGAPDRPRRSPEPRCTWPATPRRYTTGSILTVDGGAQWSMAGTGDAGPDPQLEVSSSPR